MRKQLKNVFVTALLATGLFISSCSTEDPATPLNVNMNQTATVCGKILINRNETVSPQIWSAPENISIMATVPYSSLNSSATGTYVIPLSNITYKPSGEFEIKAPVGIEGSTITVKFFDFKGTVKTNKKGEGTYPVIWKGQTQTSTKLYPGETYYLTTWKLSGSNYYEFEINVDDEI